MILRDEVLAERAQLRRQRRELVGAEAVASERRRSHGKRLSRPGLLVRHVARGHGPFLDRMDRLAGATIEHEQQAVLRNDRDGRHAATLPTHVEQRRWRLQVVVPDVVMHDLEVPEILSSERVDSDQRRAEQVGALAIAAVSIPGRRCERQIGDASLAVDGHESPDIHARASACAVAFPGLMSRLSGQRHGMKCPTRPAGDDVPTAHGAGHAERRELLRRRARDDHVAVDDRR